MFEGQNYALTFFCAAHRAFISIDNFFLAAALIPVRAFVFVGVDVFGADLPFHFAQRCLIASEIRLRAAWLICRRVKVVVEDFFGGRPRRPGELIPSRAAMA